MYTLVVKSNLYSLSYQIPDHPQLGIRELRTLRESPPSSDHEVHLNLCKLMLYKVPRLALQKKRDKHFRIVIRARPDGESIRTIIKLR